MSNITLKQLAELAGLSVRTVSRALKEQGNIAPEKKDRILELAKQYHYMPNIAARNLRLSRTNIVGILCENYGQQVFIQKLHDLEHRLEECGYYPLLGHYDRTPGKFRSLLAEWAGLTEHIILVNSLPEELRPELRSICVQYPMNFIFVDQDGGSSGHSLLIDRAGGICEAVTHLIRKGCRKIAHCGALATRREGFERAFKAFPANHLPETFIIEAPGEFENGKRCGPALIESGADAVFFDTDRMALGFLNYAADHGIRVPEDLSVIGFDDDLSGRMFHPALSTVAHPISEMNQEIVDIIRKGSGGAVLRKTFPTRFIQRATS